MGEGVSVDGQASSPLVTVMMPIYNGEEFVADALESILEQTFRDFEFLIIDDGSTDKSVEIIEGYGDPRIRLVCNDERIALIRTLNRGLELARGKYIARMDADDISLPERLERQVSFLEANLDVGVCGTWVVSMGDREGEIWSYPESAGEIRCRLLFHAALAHPTVCMRRETFDRHALRFDEAYQHAEDYELWGRASEVFPLANIGSVLLRYRIHAGSVTQTHCDAQEATVKRIHRERLGRLGLTPTEEELFIHRWVITSGPSGEILPLSELGDWLEKLLRSNEAHGFYPRPTFERLLGQFWLKAAYRNLAAGQPAVSRFIHSPLARCVALKDRIRLVGHAAKRAVRRGGGRVALQD
jgi:glycosyltransferase involved in cell wall biosynthesis